MKNAERFAEILREERAGIAGRENLKMYAVDELLGEEIKKSGDSIRKWATSRTTPAKTSDLEKLAIAIRRRGGLKGDRFEEFLVTGGHLNPAVVMNVPPVPVLPRDPFFTGREDKLSELLGSLAPGRITLLIGTGGIGKTAMLAEVIHRLFPDGRPGNQFPDGLFYYEFYKHPSVDVALEEVSRTFGQDESPANPQAAARRCLEGKQALLILDGAEEADNLDALLRVRQDCGVLVASRYLPAFTYGRRVDLDTLPLADAISVLRSWSTDQGDDLDSSVWSDDAEADSRVAKQICEIVGCLPLALRLAGRNLGRYFPNVSSFLDTLAASPLAQLDEEQRQHHSVPFLLQAMISRVDEASHEALAVVGVLSYEPFAVELISTALGMPESEIRPLLNELVKLSLLNLTHRVKGRYQVVHRLVHTYVSDPDRGLPVPESTVIHLARYYVSLINEQTRLGASGVGVLDQHRSHGLAILPQCMKIGAWREALALVRTMDSHLYMQGYWTQRLSALKIGLEAAMMQEDLETGVALLDSLGTAYSVLGQVEAAIDYYEQALAIAQELGDRYRQGLILSTIGTAYGDLGQADKAIGYYEQALEIARESDDRSSELEELYNLGSTYVALGKTDEAIEYYKQVLDIARAIGEQLWESEVLSRLGHVYADLDMVERATDYYKQALRLDRESGDHLDECSHMRALGNSYMDLGQPEQAISHFKQALVIAEEIGEPAYETQILGNLGMAHYALDGFETACNFYRRGLAIAQEIGDRHAEATHLANLGLANVALYQVEEAKIFYHQALSIYTEIQSPEAESVREWMTELTEE